MKIKEIAAAALLTLSSMASHAVTGNELLRQCREAERMMDNSQAKVDGVSFGYCIGLVEGVKNTLTVTSHVAKTNCFPPTVTNEQAVRIVLKHLRSNPESLHSDGSVHVIQALSNAFPCNQ